MHPLAGDRMTELQCLGVKVEAVGGTAIERIAHDGAVQAVGMGSVDTELVGTACLGVEGDAENLVYPNVVVIEILRFTSFRSE